MTQASVERSPEAGMPREWSRPLALVLIVAQLGLILVAARAFSIENPAFRRLLMFSAAASVVVALLPARWRIPLFALFSAGCALLLLGPLHGGSLLLVGLALVGVAHVPTRLPIRIALVVVAGVLMVLLRSNVITAPWSPAIWPILGSMFMFRMIVYLYDLNTGAVPVGFWRATAYFFMAPNLIFPLFPVVDYKTFCRSQTGDPGLRVVQSGIEWIFRGLVQLAIYRLVYHHLAIDISSVTTSTDALRFMLAGYAMYLKISGSFHVIVGILHLFGFELPLTNRNYFLAAGFTDYWRRINIYWKDFLQKVFFNPLYFRFSRRMSVSAAISVTTVIAFIATWALHSWQWFWIRGSFPVRSQDVVFWTAMGVLVLVNMLYENSFGRTRTLGKTKRSLGAELRRGLGAALTFGTICTLWTIWSTESLGDFWHVLSVAAAVDVAGAAWIVAGALTIVVLSVLMMRKEDREASRARTKAGPGVEWVPQVRLAVVLVLILSVRYAEHPLIQRALPLEMERPVWVENVLQTLGNAQLSTWDAENLDRGYYEDLTNVVNFNSQLSDLYAQRPPDWNLNQAEYETDVFPPRELHPSTRVQFKGAAFTTNRWGMRDQEYDREKPAGTMRIAVLGESNTMGQGVADGETFEALVEARLNADPPESGMRYELLNFALADCGPVAKLVTLDRGLGFGSDAVLYVGVNEQFWMVKELVLAAHEGRPLPDPRLAAALEELGVDSSTPRGEAVQLIESRSEELLTLIYRSIADRCREAGVRPLIAFLPLPRDHSEEREAGLATERGLAAEAGFDNVEMYDAFKGVEPRSLWVRPWDSHLNARGQALLADRIESELRRWLRESGHRARAHDGSRRRRPSWPGVGPNHGRGMGLLRVIRPQERRARCTVATRLPVLQDSSVRHPGFGGIRNCAEASNFAG